MARFGINSKNTLGISVWKIREIAKEIGKDHDLAQELWKTKIHEARLLAAFIDDPEQVTERQMEDWVKDFDSWDVCDQVTTDLFDQTPYAYKKVFEWSERDEEFVRRAAFSMIAGLAVHDKKAKDGQFIELFSLIVKTSEDERNYVRKAVNWALRNIGKRNSRLNKKAIQIGKKLQTSASKSARWIGNDAVKELESDAVQKRLAKKKK